MLKKHTHGYNVVDLLCKMGSSLSVICDGQFLLPSTRCG